MIRALFLFLISFIFFTSCQKDEMPVDMESQDEYWIKLHIQNWKSSISSVYGDIDDTLLVATNYDVYMTTDQGKTWNHVLESESGISAIIEHDDQLVVLTTFSSDGEQELAVGLSSFYSVDNGLTWSDRSYYPVKSYENITHVRNVVAANGDTSYRIDNNLQEIKGTVSWKHGPNKIIRTVGDDMNEIYFPSKRYLNYLQIDKKNRLYVGADGSKFVGEGEDFEWSEQDSALLYISRGDVNLIPLR